MVPLAGLVYMVSMPAGALHIEAMMWTGCPQHGTLTLSAAVAAGLKYRPGYVGRLINKEVGRFCIKRVWLTRAGAFSCLLNFAQLPVT